MDKIDLLFETKKYWSDFQINLLMVLIYKVEKQDAAFKTYKLKAKDILIERLSFEELRSETQSFLKKTYEIQIGNKLVQLPIFSSIAFIKGEGMIEVGLHPIFKTYFLELKEEYTLITLKNLLKFKSIFSKNIYLFLKETNEVITIVTIDQLKEYLSLTEAYRDYNTFKKRVILQSQKELHNTDMAFFFEEIKESRKVDSIRFKQTQNTLLSARQKELQGKLIKETKVTAYQARRIVTRFMLQEVYSILYLIKEAEYSGQIKTNIAAYTVSTFNKIILQKK